MPARPTEAYYVIEVLAVIRADEAPNSLPRQMQEWLLSAEGQKAVAESKLVPLPRGATRRP